jgi:hypothetical protein
VILRSLCLGSDKLREMRATETMWQMATAQGIQDSREQASEASGSHAN